MKLYAIVFLILLIPNLSSGCYGGPERAPGESSNLYYLTESESLQQIWTRLGYISIAPSHWNMSSKISNNYYSLTFGYGGSGSCGSDAIFIYKTLFNSLFLGLIAVSLLTYLYKRGKV